MKAHAIFRIGRDAEVRYTPNGEPVANITLATNVRSGKEEVTVWVDATLWGKRAESLAPYLTKGTAIMADLEGLHMQTYEGKNGTATKLVARVVDITLTGKKNEGGESAPRQAPASAPRPQARPPAPPPSSGFEPDDEDIPF